MTRALLLFPQQSFPYLNDVHIQICFPLALPGLGLFLRCFRMSLHVFVLVLLIKFVLSQRNWDDIQEVDEVKRCSCHRLWFKLHWTLFSSRLQQYHERLYVTFCLGCFWLSFPVHVSWGNGSSNSNCYADIAMRTVDELRNIFGGGFYNVRVIRNVFNKKGCFVSGNFGWRCDASLCE